MVNETRQQIKKSGARFSNVPELFGRHKSLCIFNKNMFQALKLGSYFAFLYILNILKGQLFTASGSLFQELLFGPAKLPGLSGNGRPSGEKVVFLNRRSCENRLVEELTGRNTGTGPKYNRNSPLLCSECFRTTKTSDILVIKNFFSQPRENFPCCGCSASSETHSHLRLTARVYELNLN